MQIDRNAWFDVPWRMPLSLVKDFSLAATRQLSNTPGLIPIIHLAAPVDRQLERAFDKTGDVAESLWRNLWELFFDISTLKPLRSTLEHNFQAFFFQPIKGSQKQPELEYLKAVNDGGPAGRSLTIMLLAAQYANLNRYVEGAEVFDRYLRNYNSQLTCWQKTIYLSCLALLKAGQAKATPLWNMPLLTALVRESLTLLSEAKKLSAEEPDFDEHLAKLIARWVSGLVNGGLPPIFGNKQVAIEDLTWVVQTVTATPEREFLAFGFLREAYYQLAVLYRAIDERASSEYLERSTYADFEKKDITLSTLFSVTPNGLRDGIKNVTVHGRGDVFTISGWDMSEMAFVLSKDHSQLIAIDCGSRPDTAEGAYNHFREHLMRSGVGVPPTLAAVLITHAHWDHVGGHKFYRNLNPRVKFYASHLSHITVAEATNHLPPTEWLMGTAYRRENQKSFEADVFVEPESELVRRGLTIGGTTFQFKLIPGGGGGTPDGMFIYLRDEAILFAGDFLVPWIGSPFHPEGDLASLFASFDWIIDDLRPRVILHGHSPLNNFYGNCETLRRFRRHLKWLERETSMLIADNKSLSDIQGKNLYPPDIVNADQADVQLPFIFMREVLINRIYNQRTGFWGPGLEGLDCLDRDEIGSVFGRYLELSDIELASAVNKMIINGDHELAGKLADWSLSQYPTSSRIRDVRKRAFLKLKEKFQSLNPFKFALYSEHINDETNQLENRASTHTVAKQPASLVKAISPAFPFRAHFVNVLGSQLHYVDVGSGRPILFLHSNPTNSYIWRNIIPYVTRTFRAIALDLIGMGRSDKPNIDYRFFDHFKYLLHFIEALQLRDMIFMADGWGAALAFHYLARHQNNVRGIAYMEPVASVSNWAEFPSNIRELFKSFRTSALGWDLIVNKNLFIERVLPTAIMRTLTAKEMEFYRQPFMDPRSRKPIWSWVNELPVEGKPADVTEAIEADFEKVKLSKVPKLLLYATPGLLMNDAHVRWSQCHVRNLTTAHVGDGIHFFQEDNPHLIGSELTKWCASLT